MLDIKIFYYFVRVWNELRDLTFNALSLHCRSCIFISNWFSYFGDYLYIERSNSKFDLKILKKLYELRNFLQKIYWYHIRMNTIKDDRNNEDKNDLIQVEKCYVCWFYCASKIIAVVSKESTFIFFAKTRTGIKHLKVFYINTMCPLCHLSQRIHINLVSLYLDHSVQTQTSTNHSDNRS